MSSPAPNGDSGAIGVWRFLVDENQPRILVRRLQAAGYFAEDVRDVGLGAHPDSDIWRYAQEHNETVITEDRDFSNIQTYPAPHAGIVIVALPDALTITTEVQIVIDGLASLAGQSLASAVITISPGRVRVRR